MNTCKKCTAELTSKNWSSSSRRKRHYICISCKSASEIIRRNKKQANEDSFKKIYENNHICKGCQVLLNSKNWKRSSAIRNVYCCKLCHNQATHRDKKDIKLQVILAYGGKCSCCDESNLCMLTIDHINEDGAQHRAKTNLIGDKMYRELKKQNYPKENYQLLCFNCNIGKHACGGVCPHKHDLKSNS